RGRDLDLESDVLDAQLLLRGKEPQGARRESLAELRQDVRRGADVIVLWDHADAAVDEQECIFHIGNRERLHARLEQVLVALWLLGKLTWRGCEDVFAALRAALRARGRRRGKNEHRGKPDRDLDVASRSRSAARHDECL